MWEGPAPAPPPGTGQCEWCPEPHTVAFELKKSSRGGNTSMYVLACAAHEHLASAAAHPQPKKKEPDLTAEEAAQGYRP